MRKWLCCAGQGETDAEMARGQTRYAQLLEAVFLQYYREGATEVTFDRSALIQAAAELGITLPKNLGDILYSFRYRTSLPASIVAKAPQGSEWIIRPAGRARYTLALTMTAVLVPSALLVETKILDATPGVINRYALSDEQALLAKLRYNRPIDIFTGLTCYSLQNHLRTTVPGLGQVETDEIYIGVDKRGMHYVVPVQAKGQRERIGIVQIEQDIALCAAKFPGLICRPVAAQFMEHERIALFECERTGGEIRIAAEKHYRLVGPAELSPEELASYQRRAL